MMNFTKLIPSLISLSGIAVDILKNRKKEDELLKAFNAHESVTNGKIKILYKEIESLKNIARLLFVGFGITNVLLILAFILIIFILKTRG